MPDLVKCLNCGFIFRLRPWLGSHYCYPQNYQIVDKCLKCGSNAYEPVKENVTIEPAEEKDG